MDSRILIIDRDCGFVEKVQHMLAGSGIEAEHAATSPEAFACISRRNYALMLIDLHMPETGGIELAKAAMGRSPVAEIVILSERGTIDDYIRAHAAGVSEFIYKSVEMKVIAAMIKRLIKKSMGRSASLQREEKARVLRILGERGLFPEKGIVALH